MDSKKKTQQQKDSMPSGPETVMDTVRKSFQYRATWSDKEEFLDVIYWQRQAIGLVIGLIFGLIPVTGIFAILGFFVINCLSTYVYFAAFQQVDDDEYGGISEILKEGLMTSFSTFLVAWIAVYSALFY